MNRASLLASDTTRLPSLAEVNASVPVPGSGWRRAMAFAGPGYLVAVGYMDPGNWATSLAAGSQFGLRLLWIVLLANVLAMLLQAAAVRLGIGARLDLAQACRVSFSRRANLALWLACEIAIVACCLAEVLGMAIALELLFRIPLAAGVVLTVLDVMLILLLQARGFRKLEAVIIALVAVVAVCFAIQIAWLAPQAGALLAAARPAPLALFSDPRQLYLAVGIVGATVMPHNLYLHSAIMQTRQVGDGDAARRAAIRGSTIDSSIALALAMLVSAAILVLAAGAFHAKPGMPVVDDLAQAFELLSPVLGVGAASTVFGIALLAAGLSSSVTSTLAGQIVMEGFLQLRLPMMLRRLFTRLVAMVPALVVALWWGSDGVNQMLVFSQVVLSIQLPFAIFPLLWFTTRRAALGEYAFGRVMALLLWLTAALIVGFDGWMLWHAVFG